MSVPYIKMSTTKDPRRSVGAIVHARAAVVTSAAECSRLYGSNAKSKLRKVPKVDSPHPCASNGLRCIEVPPKRV